LSNSKYCYKKISHLFKILREVLLKSALLNANGMPDHRQFV